MRSILKLMKELKTRINCDEVSISWNGQMLVIKSSLGNSHLKRSYLDHEIHDRKNLIESTVEYMNRYHHEEDH